MTFFKINDRQVIELFPERKAGTDRLSHISLETNDIKALRVYLASKGVKVPAKASLGRVGNLSFNIADPEGHTVEMVQFDPDGTRTEIMESNTIDGKPAPSSTAPPP